MFNLEVSVLGWALVAAAFAVGAVVGFGIAVFCPEKVRRVRREIVDELEAP